MESDLKRLVTHTVSPPSYKNWHMVHACPSGLRYGLTPPSLPQLMFPPPSGPIPRLGLSIYPSWCSTMMSLKKPHLLVSNNNVPNKCFANLLDPHLDQLHQFYKDVVYNQVWYYTKYCIKCYIIFNVIMVI